MVHRLGTENGMQLPLKWIVYSHTSSSCLVSTKAPASDTAGGPNVNAMLIVTGVELYMLPAIDMINHSTEPDKRNTLLRKSSAEVTVKVDGEPMTVQGFFTMKAGQCPCCWHYASHISCRVPTEQ